MQFKNTGKLDDGPPCAETVLMEMPKWLPSVQPFTVKEVTYCIRKLPVKKSIGADEVTFESIKMNINKFAPIHTINYNTCLHFQRAPSEYKHSVITVVPKGNSSTCDINSIEIRRPIFLLLNSYKFLTKLILSRHLSWAVDTSSGC